MKNDVIMQCVIGNTFYRKRISLRGVPLPGDQICDWGDGNGGVLVSVESRLWDSVDGDLVLICKPPSHFTADELIKIGFK